MSRRPRVRVNQTEVKKLLKAPAMQDEIRRQTRKIHSEAEDLGTVSRVDFSADGRRARGAIIAGYENEATAERTRRILLQALNGAGND